MLNIKKQSYKAKSGRTLYKPVISEKQGYQILDSQEGFCLACGSTQDGVEPDASNYECESCQEKKVYGLSELLVIGLMVIED